MPRLMFIILISIGFFQLPLFAYVLALYLFCPIPPLPDLSNIRKGLKRLGKGETGKNKYKADKWVKTGSLTEKNRNENN